MGHGAWGTLRADQGEEMQIIHSSVEHLLVVSKLSSLVAAGLLLGFLGLAQEAAYADGEQGEEVVARSLSVTIATSLGETIHLELVDDDFSSPDFDGTIEFTGTFTDVDGTIIPTTVTTSIQHIQEQSPIWQNLMGEEIVLSVSLVGTVANVHFIEAVDAVSVSTTIQPVVSGVTGAVAVNGEYLDLEDSLSGLVNSTSGLAVLAGNYLGAVLTDILDAEPQAAQLPVAFLDCVRTARETCGKPCPPDGKERACVKDIDWTTDGGCSFDCQSVQECCGT